METTTARRSSKGGGVANSFPVAEGRPYLIKDVVESKEAQKSIVNSNSKLKIDENEKNHSLPVLSDKRKEQSTRPAKVDDITTEEEIESCVGYKANIYDTSLVVCTLRGCNKYFTKIDKFTIHRKREHDTSDINSDIWIFGNMKKGDSNNQNNNSSSSKAEGVVTKDSSSSQPTVKSNSPKKSNPPNISEKNNNSQQESLSSVVTSINPSPAVETNTLSSTNKRIREQVSVEELKKDHHQLHQQPSRPPRRYQTEEEHMINADLRLRYQQQQQQRNNRQNAGNPIYGMGYETGEPPRYYNMQMHAMGFGLSPYGEIAPPRYDGGYNEMAYGGFYGGGNRRFMNNPPPPPPPQRRSR
ncbi:10718_t:CDS:2 [Ambispora gerdemannii]|uniref:10718_t:CDS:1 n=1 Tax=Ambispora gerdemannii TaxID=144530 RepID=A0A9N8YIH6_9GLOM|nr:10718_t:CDS:2 [Ambispora gerdemannii]